ncbi:hypothetical protein ARGLB_020_00060 [Arthrobacter globiformis NBRC 12137]|uniref:Uncharacterized protein n=1 Tax=Arthrobacter globiformis (strain ATCC 8010 / DSM 20124 / JCM 1332 / NBRC 12137 / NCIMB 8907 / NRRL B-2979 / 168) TaxID=1077972 RepID=H0QID5_ARTG1|nr:hypothetical protein ARGLB_020_00060 [Arthrobacter globiformis NBRC 12137]
MFFLADVGTAGSGSDVGIGDGFAYDQDFFTLRRDGLGDILGDYILTQPRPAGRLKMAVLREGPRRSFRSQVKNQPPMSNALIRRSRPTLIAANPAEPRHWSADVLHQ